GITQTMFNAGSQDFTRMAPDDQLDVRRYSLSFSHQHQISSNIRLNTIAYGYTTTRNWNRQDFSRNTGSAPANWTGVVWGDESIPGGAVYMRNGTGNRNRQFEVAGVEPKLEIGYQVGGLPGELTVGTRFLYERAFEQRVNGTKAGVRAGNLIEDEIRTGHAVSAYAQNKIEVGNRISLTAGLRLEYFDYERDINRRAFRINDVNVIRDTVLTKGNTLSQLIPGVGFNYRPASNISIFGGTHRGFAPPRVKDAISSVGEVYELDAESSWNHELGFRSDVVKGIYSEITAFYMDFSNQIITVAESGGGAGTGLVNAGATRHKGIEGSLLVDIGLLTGLKKVGMTFDINATYVEAYYSQDRLIRINDDKSVNVLNNRTPYAPKWLINGALTMQLENGFGFRVTGNYVSSQFGDELNTVEASHDGQIGEIPAYFILDANAHYTLDKWKTRFNISVKNLTNERYIVTRRPQGIRVGIPQLVTAGVSISL
ncbi:MAG: TonB-dependent receptor family protein, partial [Cyclobacteriaceae bacterium]